MNPVVRNNLHSGFGDTVAVRPYKGIKTAKRVDIWALMERDTFPGCPDYKGIKFDVNTVL